MRTDTEMMNLILQIAESLQVEAVALSGPRANPQAPKDEFQDYDVVYIVDDLEDLISDLSWLDPVRKSTHRTAQCPWTPSSLSHAL